MALLFCRVTKRKLKFTGRPNYVSCVKTCQLWPEHQLPRPYVFFLVQVAYFVNKVKHEVINVAICIFLKKFVQNGERAIISDWVWCVTSQRHINKSHVTLVLLDLYTTY